MVQMDLFAGQVLLPSIEKGRVDTVGKGEGGANRVALT